MNDEAFIRDIAKVKQVSDLLFGVSVSLEEKQIDI